MDSYCFIFKFFLENGNEINISPVKKIIVNIKTKTERIFCDSRGDTDHKQSTKIVDVFVKYRVIPKVPVNFADAF